MLGLTPCGGGITPGNGAAGLDFSIIFRWRDDFSPRVEAVSRKSYVLLEGTSPNEVGTNLAQIVARCGALK